MNVEGLLKSSKERSHIDASPQDVRPRSPAPAPPYPNIPLVRARHASPFHLFPVG